MNIRPGVTFDDVILVPKHSSIPSRKDTDLSSSLNLGVKLGIPIVSANMKHVTESSMALSLANLGGLPILHRFMPYTDIVTMFKETRYSMGMQGNREGLLACSIGIKEEDMALAKELHKAGCHIICVDVAHGDHDNCVQMVEWLSKNLPGLTIIAGNVATAEGALRLYNAGAQVIKVGIGGGSLCTTRIKTGCGVPQLTALEDVYNASLMFETKTEEIEFPYTYSSSGFGDSTIRLSGFTFPHTTTLPAGRKFKIIADGGIRDSGDIVKALCFSDAVMLGNLLAGTEEAPGEVMYIDGKRYKQYAGSSTHKTNHVEGISALVPCKGYVHEIITSLMDGLRSGLSYQGSRSLQELKMNPQFMSVSHAGLIESHPHDVMVK